MSKYKPLHIACKPPMIGALVCGLFAVFVPILWMQIVNLILCIILVMDAGARYREYVILVNKGAPWTGRDIRYFQSSYCRRHAAVQAGMPKKIFDHLGYRWWHITPDEFPQCFFKLGFWRNMLGLKKSKKRS